MNLPPIEERLAKLLSLAAYEIRPCKACGTTLYFVRHQNGKAAPYTSDGVNHFIACPAADSFRKKKAEKPA
jgi:hypothetical protein